MAQGHMCRAFSKKETQYDRNGIQGQNSNSTGSYFIIYSFKIDMLYLISCSQNLKG